MATRLKCLFIVFISLVSFSTVFAQSSKPSAEAMELAKAYDRAILKQDANAFENVLSDDYTLVDWDGEKRDKAWMIAEARKGTVKLDYAKSENNVYRVYRDTVVWTGDWIEKGTIEGEPFERKGPFTTVLAKRNGSWRVVSDQATKRTSAPNLDGIWKLHARIDDGGNVHQLGPKKPPALSENTSSMEVGA